MITILINTSVTWLCSLLLYELLLKKETFHQLNRFYLLLTFMVGLVLPLLPWGHAVQFNTLKADGTSVLQAPAGPVADATAVTGIKNEAQSPVVNWWLILYLAGVTAGVLYLLRDLVRLWLLYRRAVKRRSG
jgi:bla regulator protein blaR1